jgi:hypothetical protein
MFLLAIIKVIDLHVLVPARLSPVRSYRLCALSLGSTGVVYRDSGTSSLDARKEGPGQLLPK